MLVGYARVSTWTHAEGSDVRSSEILDGLLSTAYRPADSASAFLTKLEFRSYAVSGAVAGKAGPAGRTALTIDDDARARRLIGSVSAIWSPMDAGRGMRVHRHEIGLFTAVRHSLTADTTVYAAGPQVGVSPADDLRLTVGYNFSGFRNPDFAASRTISNGLFAGLKFTFDADTLGLLGMER